jgi:hypothetical protein
MTTRLSRARRHERMDALTWALATGSLSLALAGWGAWSVLHPAPQKPLVAQRMQGPGADWVGTALPGDARKSPDR